MNHTRILLDTFKIGRMIPQSCCPRSFIPFIPVLSTSCCVEQTPVMWLHGIDDQVVKFSAGQAGPPFLARADVKCEFQV